MSRAIKILVPYYRALNWAEISLYAAAKLADQPKEIAVTVISMADTAGENSQASEALMDTYKLFGSCLWSWMPEICVIPGSKYGGKLVGGEPLPGALLAGTQQGEQCPITITMDTDAVFLVKGWDTRIRSLMSDHALASINPRSDHGIFEGQAEWNLMAFDTVLFNERVKNFGPEYDIGHKFTRCCRETGSQQHLWPLNHRPLNGRGAAICGDDMHPQFAFHAFYSSRKYQDPQAAQALETSGEARWMLREDEEREMINRLYGTVLAAHG